MPPPLSILDIAIYIMQRRHVDISELYDLFRFPRKLIKHLQDERNLTVEKNSAGVYYINKETFQTQIIVIPELPPASSRKENLTITICRK